MEPAEQLSRWADRLRDMAAIGLMYSQNTYDRQNYQELQDLSMTMLAFASGLPAGALEPLRATLFSRPTPLSTGDAAIFDEQGRLLLIKRADNGKWALPGGALEVGETPVQGVLREALEETGLACEARALIGVHDSRLCGSTSPYHLYMYLFLCRPLNSTTASTPTHAHESLDMGWFSEDQLPAPEDIDPGHLTRLPLAFQAWKTGSPAYFDRASSAVKYLPRI
jgi:ADP-ribose pyrophosphatase YjhB (NUDIX family)